MLGRRIAAMDREPQRDDPLDVLDMNADDLAHGGRCDLMAFPPVRARTFLAVAASLFAGETAAKWTSSKISGRDASVLVEGLRPGSQNHGNVAARMRAARRDYETGRPEFIPTP